MKNQTSFPDFYIVAFSASADYKLYVFTLFLLLYLTGLLANSVIITVISTDKHLHTPMYLFLCNLSLIDIFYPTITVPNLLHMLLSGNFKVTFIQCFTQMYFFYGIAGAEIVILFTMAYDRYVAICKPLHYHAIFSGKRCVRLMLVMWLFGCLNSFLFLFPATKMSFCCSYSIDLFFCDAKSLLKIACANVEVLFIVVCMQVGVVGFCPFFCSLMSYIKIISAILKIKSREGRKKAFSTCSSHITVLTIFYGTGTFVYMIPPKDQYKFLELIFTVLYTVITPMLNPLIYSLQNKDVKRALKKSFTITSERFK